jgi:hypothetical protein
MLSDTTLSRRACTHHRHARVRRQTIAFDHEAVASKQSVTSGSEAMRHRGRLPDETAARREFCLSRFRHPSTASATSDHAFCMRSKQKPVHASRGSFLTARSDHVGRRRRRIASSDPVARIRWLLATARPQPLTTCVLPFDDRRSDGLAARRVLETPEPRRVGGHLLAEDVRPSVLAEFLSDRLRCLPVKGSWHLPPPPRGFTVSVER